METPAILKTTNYDKFNLVTGNRAVDKFHITELVNSIAEKNLLPFNPIIVSSHMEVIDGQHRLEAAKQLGLEIYYIIAEPVNIQDVRRLNAHLRNWKTKDYINSYCAKGDENYVVLSQFCEAYMMPITVAAAILGGYKNARYGGLWASLKNGHFKVKDAKSAEKFADFLLQMVPFSATKVIRNREFIFACSNFSASQLEKFISKLKKKKTVIQRKFSAREYIQQIESVLYS